ncbi:hypothetical protein [Acetobacterium wieringae]|uniref:Uncharacterized protein n=1 Tax=Acetobacterium wieringae TaxID=52694 RepID=A0A1F2PCY2_9FIRM|nr:hypothetical protein [Acetobacterium wieringae]OFV69227.1 hypothetical protein ACWI_32710 [Acetobacterium wieringae]
MITKHNHAESCNHHYHSGHHHHGIESHLHDDALVCSGKRDIIGDLETIKQNLADEIEILAKWIQEMSGIIGHVKALVQCDSPVTMISTTGEDVTVKEIAGSSIHVSVVAIVFNTNVQSLECRIATLFDTLQKQTD